MKTRLSSLVAIASLLCSASMAQASLSIFSVVGGQPYNGVNYVNFDDIPLGSGGGTTTSPSGNVAVSFTPDAAVVSGAASGLYAAPFISNSNGVLFGDNTVSGADGTQYITTGSTGAFAGSQVTLNFGSGQKYLGILWGSVDTYNTLTFNFTDGSPSQTITGSQITAFANGNQGINGTYYVNINSTSPFSSVVATSSQYAFEFDNVAYGPNAIPEATTIAVWSGLSLLGWVAYRRRAS